MRLTVLRYNSEKDYTDGLLMINGEFECFTLEDEFRTKKVRGETRIPNGTYEVKLRNIGAFNSRYSKKFPAIHQGMLHVTDVPNFTHILIHIGNDDEDTAGCLLVGSTADKDKGFIGASTKAYKDMYRKVVTALLDGEKVMIEYKNI